MNKFLLRLSLLCTMCLFALGVSAAPDKDYLCFTANEAGSTVKLNKYGSPNDVTLKYSTDGTTWTDYVFGTEIPLTNAGDKVYFRNKSDEVTGFSSNSLDCYYFVMTGSIAASGNVMSLVDKNCETLEIPCDGCFASLFDECKSLTTAPELPATTLTVGCYVTMFSGCTSLTTAPELPATELADECYHWMFEYCTSLTTPPQLPATILASNCYSSMFKYCESLTTAPELPATTLESNCYSNMFANCTSLTTAPQLPATTLEYDCYMTMFSGCTSLEEVKVAFTEWDPSYATQYWLYDAKSEGTFVCPSELDTTTRGPNTVPEGWNMFSPANTTPTSAYVGESVTFATAGGGVVDNIKYYVKGPGDEDYVPLDGNTFAPGAAGTYTVKVVATDYLFTEPMVSEIPFVAESMPDYLSFAAGEANSKVQLNKTGEPTDVTLQYRTDGTTWTDYVFGTEIPLTNAGDKVYFRNKSDEVTGFSTDEENYYSFVMDGSVSADGNVMSLVDKSCETTTIPCDNCFINLFNGCEDLTTAPELPATTLEEGCYDSMFEGCTGLTEAPELPATTMEDGCYREMFKDCTGLTEAPELPAKTLADECYKSMFEGCTSLEEVKVAFTAWTPNNATEDWLDGVAEIGTFVCPSGLDTTTRGSSTVPEDWNVFSPANTTPTSAYVGESVTFTTAGGECVDNITYYVKKDGGEYVPLDGNTFTPDVAGTYTVKVVATDDFFTEPMVAEIPFTVNADMPDYLSFTANEANSKVQLNKTGEPTDVTLQYSTDGTTWKDYTFGNDITLTNAGDKVYFRNKSDEVTGFSTDEDNYYSFVMDGSVSADGNVMSLVDKSCETTTIPCDNCFINLFNGCEDLTTAPELPATTLEEGCYDSMFEGCTGLGEAPELPATELKDGCYREMFKDCTSLEEAPELPATTLADECYKSMFEGCTNLEEVKVAFTEWEPNSATAGWLDEVAEIGTFVCPSGLDTTTRGSSTVPEDWNVFSPANTTPTSAYVSESVTFTTAGGECVDNITYYVKKDGGEYEPLVGNTFTPDVAGTYTVKVVATDDFFTEPMVAEIPFTVAESMPDYLSFTAGADGSTVQLNKTGEPTDVTLQYSTDGKTWTDYTFGTVIPLAEEGDKVYFRNKSDEVTGFSKDAGNYYSFVMDGSVSADGNVMSLVDKSCETTTIPCDNCFINLFNGCEDLTTAPELPATELKKGCYDSMFEGCTGLGEAPELPATELKEGCYREMFKGCEGLEEAPELPATTLEKGCYDSMFKGCTGLTEAPELPAKTLADECYKSMFEGCTSLEEVKVAFTEWEPEGATEDWLSGVKSEGTFVCPSELGTNETIKRGDDYVPNGWTVVNPGITELTAPTSAYVGEELSFDATTANMDDPTTIKYYVKGPDDEDYIELGDGIDTFTPDVAGEYSVKAVATDGFFTTEKIVTFEVKAAQYVLKVTTLGWASLYYDRALVIPDGTKVYYASERNGDVVNLLEIKDGNIPAMTAVVVQAEPGDYIFPFAEEETVDPLEGTNLFTGLLVDTPTSNIQAENEGKTIYVLVGKNPNGTPIFGKYIGDTLGAYKMYLPLDSKASQIKFEVKGDDFADGIVNITGKAADSRMYNTMGMPVGAGYKGIILNGGKKFINIKK